jgi:hypothetical protein
MNPLWPDANHKLRFFGESPRFLEEKVSAPFGRVPFEECRYARLKFQTVLYRCNFNRDGGTETRTLACEALRGSSSKFNNCDWISIGGRLSEDIPKGETQTRNKQEFHAALVDASANADAARQSERSGHYSGLRFTLTTVILENPSSKVGGFNFELMRRITSSATTRSRL